MSIKATGAMALATVGLLCTGCAPHHPSMKALFGSRPTPVMQTFKTADGRTLAAAETGNPRGPLVVMIHGTPGEWQAFLQVMADPKLEARARLVSVDRPGWAGSAAGGLETSLAKQAAAIDAVLNAYPQNRPAIVVGHSLGGPVAARVAMDFPQQVNGLVLVAGSIDPDLEKATWYQTLARSPLVKWMIPSALVKADVEMKPLKAELELMQPLWTTVHMPVVVLQGDKDALVPPGNADFAQRMLTHADVKIIRIPDAGHLIPWEHPDLIVQAINTVLDKADTRSAR